MPKAKTDANSDDPNKLIRAEAGRYRTSDERFEVRQAALGWFLIDSTATDQLGQELTRGPFPTLKAVTDELPEARRTTIKPLPKPRGGPTRSAASPAAKRKAKAPPKTWLDGLTQTDAAAARRLIRAVSLEGIEDADALVRAARKAQEPIVARRVLEHRLDRLLNELPQAERDTARKVVARVLEIVAVNGTKVFDPLPGWALVAVEPGGDAPGGSIVPKLPRH